MDRIYYVEREWQHFEIIKAACIKNGDVYIKTSTEKEKVWINLQQITAFYLYNVAKGNNRYDIEQPGRITEPYIGDNYFIASENDLYTIELAGGSTFHIFDEQQVLKQIVKRIRNIL